MKEKTREHAPLFIGEIMNSQTKNSDLCQFASDNYSGICPEALQAMIEANEGYSRAYGNDYWTEKASNKIRELFDIDCEVFFVFNGTSANSLAISTLCKSYHSVICHEFAHIETDECGAPELFSNGTKILTVPGNSGKIDIQSAEKIITKRNDIHFPKPKAVSITQSTEVGTVYTLEEIKEIGNLAKKYHLRVHMDGARFANSLAHLNLHPSQITWKSGVDVLCFGGTKNGMAVGEAIIFFDKELAYEFDYHCKQSGQLASKMRFISAPWIKMLESGAWISRARHSNSMASLLCSKLSEIDGIEIMHQCEANAVFVKFPAETLTKIREKGWYFYDFIGTGYNRLMCSWKTSENDITSFINDVKACI